MIERVGEWLVRHPMALATPLIVLLVAVSITFIRAEQLRDEVQTIETACDEIKTGPECQQLFRESVRSFNERTVCVIERKLDLGVPGHHAIECHRWSNEGARR